MTDDKISPATISDRLGKLSFAVSFSSLIISGLTYYSAQYEKKIDARNKQNQALYQSIQLGERVSQYAALNNVIEEARKIVLDKKSDSQAMPVRVARAEMEQAQQKGESTKAIIIVTLDKLGAPLKFESLNWSYFAGPSSTIAVDSIRDVLRSVHGEFAVDGFEIGLSLGDIDMAESGYPVKIKLNQNLYESEVALLNSYAQRYGFEKLSPEASGNRQKMAEAIAGMELSFRDLLLPKQVN